jgi:hypothetical protein
MDKTVTSFPTMGTSAAHAVNVSGKPSRYTKAVKKTGNAKGGMIEAALTEGVRRQVHERMGATYAPTTQIVVQQDPAAGANLRNTKIVPSRAGVGDFYLRRRYGQNS